MLFSSSIFLYVFMPALLLLYFVCPNKTWKNCVLLAFSLLFYGWGEPVYLFLMIGVVFVNYFAGYLMARPGCEGKRRRAVLAAAIALDLLSLGIFKYTGMLLETVNLIPGVALPVPQITMPIGISFFTFQAMSYTVDVFRRTVPAQKRFYKVLLYISLFPQLVAGPIVQYGDVADQIENRSPSADEMWEGVVRIACGLGKKVLLADACLKAVTYFLDKPTAECSVLGLWAGIIFYAMQIYFDFSGYSDMAIGLGHLFGFSFRENFDHPYMSLSATEFWRRWHISLGSFFREYLYIPLGGNRSHPIRNLFVVWFLTGLWHGAEWNFVAWGLFYGVLILFERKALFPLYKKIGAVASRIISVVYMFFVTTVGWTIFYYTEGLTFAQRIGAMFGGASIPLTTFNDVSYLTGKVWLLALCLLLSFPIVPALLRRIETALGKANANGAFALRRIAQLVFVVGVFFLATAFLTGNTYTPNIYSRF